MPETAIPHHSLDKKQRKYILDWLRANPVDIPHMLQVSRIALQIYDSAAALHKLPIRARCLLEAAALLHDIGTAKDERKHHKHSRDLILAKGIPGFTHPETEAIASIARYHRKASPSRKHTLYNSHDRQTREQVRALAAILRIADGLDRSHSAAIDRVRFWQPGSSPALVIRTARDIPAEIYGFEKKRGLWEKVFGSPLALEFDEPA